LRLQSDASKAAPLKRPFAPPAAALMRNVISRKENFIKSKERNINGGGANAELISTLSILPLDSLL
jgi:hypothetical protein